MKTSYPGPLRHEPLAVELHNTLYAVAREPFDGLETVDGLKAWLVGIRDRLPAAARGDPPPVPHPFPPARTTRAPARPWGWA